LLQLLQGVPSVSDVWKDSDGASISDEPNHQTLAVSGVGHGYDRQNPSGVE
jgi:hypothetical protein